MNHNACKYCTVMLGKESEGRKCKWLAPPVSHVNLWSRTFVASPCSGIQMLWCPKTASTPTPMGQISWFHPLCIPKQREEEVEDTSGSFFHCVMLLLGVIKGAYNTCKGREKEWTTHRIRKCSNSWTNSAGWYEMKRKARIREQHYIVCIVRILVQ